MEKEISRLKAENDGLKVENDRLRTLAEESTTTIKQLTATLKICRAELENPMPGDVGGVEEEDMTQPLWDEDEAVVEVPETPSSDCASSSSSKKVVSAKRKFADL